MILLEPTDAPEAKPLALIVTAEFELAHVTVLVRFCVLLSLNVPVAVNWMLVPLAIDVLGALMVIDLSVAAVTASMKLFEVMPL